MKMTYRNRDREKTIVKTVSFCGQGRDAYNDNNAAIKEGCYTEENNADGFDVEACFCDSDMCNAGPAGPTTHYMKNPNEMTLMVLLILLLYCSLM